MKNYYKLNLSTLLKLMGIVNSIPNEWKLIIKLSQQDICLSSNDTFEISIENAMVNVLKVTSKMLYNEFKCN